MILGVLIGVAVSLLYLLPGVHPASVLLLALPVLAGLGLSQDGLLAIAAVSTGAGCVLSILHTTYMPVSVSMLAHADVAAKMAHQGLGKVVVKLHTEAVNTAMAALLFVGGFFTVWSLLGLDVAGGLSSLAKVLSPFILGAVLLLSIWKSPKRLASMVIASLAGLLGFMTFNDPGIGGTEWTMLPLLGGLFMAPAMTSLLRQIKPLRLPRDRQSLWEEEGHTDAAGALLGMATGLLAGLGTSSLISLFRHDDMDEAQMLVMGSSGEAGNNMFALLLFSLIGSTRSGTAAALAEATTKVDAFDALMCLGFLLVGVMVGNRLLVSLHEPYRRYYSKIPQWMVAVVVLLVTSGLVLRFTGLSGTIVFLSGWLISTQAKSWFVPNQVLLTCMVGPVLVYYTGASQWLGKVIGL